MAIPKKIHYCWFGPNQMSKLAVSCINSWKRYLPEYELILWNENNFDINSNQYVREAYESKKYAFVTDYVRLYALYHHGGIYMDTDVEVVKPFDKFLEHTAFTGCENSELCVTGTMGAEKGHDWIDALLSNYEDRTFILPDGSYDITPNTQVITDITMEKFGWKPKNQHQILKSGLNIYSFEVFCAKDWKTGKVSATNNTYSIHHFLASWHTKKHKFKNKVEILIGPRWTQRIVDFKRKIEGA